MKVHYCSFILIIFSRESRGEMFLFFCHQNQPVIEIFFSGQAALSMDADLESTTRKVRIVFPIFVIIIIIINCCFFFLF